MEKEGVVRSAWRKEEMNLISFFDFLSFNPLLLKKNMPMLPELFLFALSPFPTRFVHALPTLVQNYSMLLCPPHMLNPYHDVDTCLIVRTSSEIKLRVS